jgi:GTPase SAR1 family protein
VGQYSVGKTSFIRYLLGRDFPGQRIGPEPTTDRFTVLLNGPEERTIPGNALSGTFLPIHHYGQLTSFYCWNQYIPSCHFEVRVLGIS